MVRLVAILAVTLGLSAFGAYLHVLGKGPFASLEARHQREMKDRIAIPERIEPMTHAEFLALPRDLSVAEYSGLERRAVAVEGEVRAFFRATDGDYHAELAPPANSAPGLASITTEITPQWHGDALGGWGFERLASVFRPQAGAWAMRWDRAPARVRLSGWLLYDHESDVPARLLGRPAVRRASDWEIHPVTKIERWDEPLAAWIEVQR